MRKQIFPDRRGVTLLLTMLTLMLTVSLLSRLVVSTTSQRLAIEASAFADQAQWIAEGTAQQWTNASKDTDHYLQGAHWRLSNGMGSVIDVEIWPTSVQEKLQVQSVTLEELQEYWRRQPSSLVLAADADKRLLESGNTLLEAILDPLEFSSQCAYIVPGLGRGQDVAPADRLTVWGDGRIDLNRCSQDLMRAKLKDFTDSQLAGLINLRSQAPIQNWDIAQRLSLSEHQAQELSQLEAVAPSEVELVIRLRKGGLSALYHAVVELGSPGRVLEVRPIY